MMHSTSIGTCPVSHISCTKECIRRAKAVVMLMPEGTISYTKQFHSLTFEISEIRYLTKTGRLLLAPFPLMITGE